MTRNQPWTVLLFWLLFATGATLLFLSAVLAVAHPVVAMLLFTSSLATFASWIFCSTKIF